MYYVKESRRGYAIFYKEEDGFRKTRDEYISDGLSLKQANKWCDRLNRAFRKGYASDW